MKTRNFLGFGAVMMVIVGILSIIVPIMMLKSIANDVEDIKKDKDSYIGKHVVIDNDTLTVINNNLFMDSYTLSNSLKVNKTFLDSTMIK